jgi:D-sedoheptulose 7-phosphate isomerase
MIEAIEQSTLRSNGAVNHITERFHEIASTFLRAASSEYPEQLRAAAALISNALRAGHKLLVFGNGGSAADAQHLCGELVVRFQANRRALPAISLCGDAAVMTACGNDFSYAEIFSRQIEALGMPGDVALGLSTSGNSPNVVRAFEAARERGLHSILMTGPQPGKASRLCDLVLAAPGMNTARIQELHLASYHLLCEFLDADFS